MKEKYVYIIASVITLGVIILCSIAISKITAPQPAFNTSHMQHWRLVTDTTNAPRPNENIYQNTQGDHDTCCCFGCHIPGTSMSLATQDSLKPLNDSTFVDYRPYPLGNDTITIRAGRPHGTGTVTNVKKKRSKEDEDLLHFIDSLENIIHQHQWDSPLKRQWTQTDTMY